MENELLCNCEIGSRSNANSNESMTLQSPPECYSLLCVWADQWLWCVHVWSTFHKYVSSFRVVRMVWHVAMCYLILYQIAFLYPFFFSSFIVSPQPLRLHHHARSSIFLLRCFAIQRIVRLRRGCFAIFMPNEFSSGECCCLFVLRMDWIEVRSTCRFKYFECNT